MKLGLALFYYWDLESEEMIGSSGLMIYNLAS